jgi:hypothetical protein
MSTETLCGIVIGGFLSLVITWFFHVLQGRRKKAIRKQLEDIDLHMEYLDRLRSSDEYRLGMAFFFLFGVLFLIALGLLLPAVARSLPFSWLGPVCSSLSFLCFLAAAMAAFMEAGSFRDLSNIERTTARIDEKRKKLLKKLEDA